MQQKVEFSKCLRKLRKKAGLKQQELGARANIDPTLVSRYERGRATPALETVQKLADGLGVTVGELLNGPKPERIEITLSWDFEEIMKGEIDMTNGNGFDLVLGDNGKVGVKGAATFKSLQELRDFAAAFAKELEEGYNFQIQRGRIQAAPAD